MDPTPSSTAALWSDATPPRLRASRDRHTGAIEFPPLSPHSPLAPQHEPIELEATGTVYAFTVIHPGAKSGVAPFALGFVDLPGPVRLFGRLEGAQRPVIGARCTAQPDARFGYVFAVVAEAA